MSTVNLPPGGTWQQRQENVLGDALVMEDVSCNQPLLCTVTMGEPPSNGAATARIQTQSRGLYLKPDQSVEATVDMVDGAPRTLAVNGPWLTGTDSSTQPPVADTLQGDYGAIAHLRLHVTPGRYQRLLVVLVPRGGLTGALQADTAHMVSAGGGLVLINQRVVGPTMVDYDFTLPANSFAPVHFLVVPLLR